MKNDLLALAANFAFEGTVTDIRPVGEGWINDTFFVETSGSAPNYILQRKNKNIFTDIPAMMQNIYKVTTHLKQKITARGGDTLREALTVVPARDGALYYLDAEGEYWAACLFIDDTIAYDKADSEKLARQGGMGIGRFQVMLSDMTDPLTNILPGFHDMRFRFGQWDKVLAKDPAGRKKKLAREIDWIESRREQMLAFWHKVETGELPMRVTHNDTKISNILFDKQDRVLCVIDLDTVLNSTCLNDFGDAIRTYTNAGKEDDECLDNVFLKMNYFKSYTEGYLSETISFLNEAELNSLAFSANYIIYEQVLRFLMDYIDGDHYYKIKSEHHNLIRTNAQYKLLLSAEENYEAMNRIVFDLAAQLRK